MFALLKPCIVNTALVVNVNNATDVYIGHGDGDTKWKGWDWNVLRVRLVIPFFLYINNLIKTSLLLNKVINYIK